MRCDGQSDFNLEEYENNRLERIIEKMDTLDYCPFMDKCADGFYGNAEECRTQEYAMCNQFYIFIQEYLKSKDLNNPISY